MLFLAVVSTTAAFAKTGETPATAANRQEVSDRKPVAPLETLLSASCTLSEVVNTWDSGSYIVTTTTTCPSCRTGAEACAIAAAAQAQYIAAHF